MSEGKDDVIYVTMTRNAAEMFKAALIFAHCRLTPEDYPPASAKDQIAYDHSDWLRWGVSRVTNAEMGDARRREPSDG